MSRYGLLIDYEFCVGCHSCEMACQQEHNRSPGEPGICIREVEPELSGGKTYYFPFPTDNCNLCGRRLARGLQPACVHNCWAGVMKFGKIEELAKDIAGKNKMVLWTPH